MADNLGKSFKVIKFKIDNVVGQNSWTEFTQLLRDVRYRVFRLANLVVSEAYLAFHLWRTKGAPEYKTDTIDRLNNRLWEILQNEKKHKGEQDDLKQYAKGAVTGNITAALWQYKLRPLLTKSNWGKVIRGDSALPTFRRQMAIPVRCDQPANRRLQKMPNGSIELDLMVTVKPYPRVVLDTRKIDGSAKETLQRFFDDPADWRQRCYEIKEDELTRQWWVSVAYEYKPERPVHLKPDIAVGVDIGYSVPLYAAISNGLARLGKREFGAISHRIKALRSYVIARRRDIQQGGRQRMSGDSARSGHGRKRKLLPTEVLQKRIDNAQTTINHQLSKAVIDFAIDHAAGVIQIENLKGLGPELSGTFLGQRWRYYQLQQFIKYKADAEGIKVVPINPRFTSRRCSECGHINEKFDRDYRDNEGRKQGKTAQFICPQCGYEAGPDYNAARNIATIDIENKIRLQCNKQSLKYEEE